MIGRFRAEPAAGAAAEAYLAEIAALLSGSGRYRSQIVAELRSGLADAARAHRLAGHSAREAEHAAISECGDAGAVATGFRAELAARQARRVGIGLLLTGPLVGSLWAATGAASHLRIGQILPWDPTASPLALKAGASLIAVAVAITAWGAIVSVAAGGRLSRWLPARPRSAPIAAAVAGYGAIGADGLGLLLFALGLATIPGGLAPAPAAVAVAASAVRMIFAGRAAGRCLALRAGLSAF